MSEKSDWYIKIEYPVPIKWTNGYWEDSVAFTQIWIFERSHAIRNATLEDSTSLAQVRANVMMRIEAVDSNKL